MKSDRQVLELIILTIVITLFVGWEAKSFYDYEVMLRVKAAKFDQGICDIDTAMQKMSTAAAGITEPLPPVAIHKGKYLK